MTSATTSKTITASHPQAYHDPSPSQSPAFSLVQAPAHGRRAKASTWHANGLQHSQHHGQNGQQSRLSLACAVPWIPIRFGNGAKGDTHVAMDLSPDERLESSVPQDVVDAGPEVEEFANALDDCLSPRLTKAEKKSRLLDLPRKYYANAIRRLDSKKHALDVDMDTDDGLPDDYLDEIEQLEKEAQTWDLLRRVLPLRYPDQLEASPYARLKIGGSRRNLLHDFLQKDPLAQERCAVLQWLQGNASSGPDIDELTRDLQQNADRGDIIAHGWLHTRSAIKLRKSVGGWPKAQERPSPSLTRSLTTANGEPLVTQLDPDATLRQDRKLEPKDEFFERAIWLGCFEHLRRGSSLETIRDWCQERTEMWRAVSMSAMLLSFDDQESPVEMDPKSLALWRRMCFNLARQGGSDDHERAVYGLLSGDIQTVEKIATTWDDFLFANYNALLRTQLDSYVLGQCSAHEASALTQSLPSFDAVQYHGDPNGVEKRLIQLLESRKDIQAQAMQPNKALQAAFIAKDIHHHLYEQGVVMGSDSNAAKSVLFSRSGPEELGINRAKYFSADQHKGLRIVAHIYLLISTLDKVSTKDGKVPESIQPKSWEFRQENIIAAYTDYMHRAGLQELIPLYCSLLEASKCYEVLSSSLILEDDVERRKMLLRLAQKATINTLAFVEEQASLCYQAVGPLNKSFAAKSSFKLIEEGPPQPAVGRPILADFFDNTEPEAGENDVAHEHLVRALEWLSLEDKTWPSVFSYGTKAYKFFLSMRNVARINPKSMLTRLQDTCISTLRGDSRRWPLLRL